MPAISQNVFDFNDAVVRYDSTKVLGSAQRPDPAKVGLQKWVSTSMRGISGAWNTTSYKAYYLNTSSVRMPYRIKFPRSFNNPDSVAKKYPVAVFLHGAAEVGCPTNNGVYNNELQLVLDGKLFASWVDNNQFDGFLVYPQYTSTDCFASWNELPISNLLIHLSMIDSIAKYARADVDRVVITGLSAGGYGAWRLANSYPQRIAKIMPSAAAGTTANREQFVHIPIWFATGGKDPDPSPAQAAYNLKRMTDIGGDIRYTQYPELGHAVWNSHWAEPDFVVEMNNMHKANPLVFFKRNEFCPGETIAARLGITAGFYAYEWQRDGVTIATRTNNVNTIVVPEHVTSYLGNEITVKSIGTYRVRFKRTSSGVWSVYSPKPAVVKVKTITETAAITVGGAKSKVLPALDGSTTVPLQLPTGFINYEWYRVSDNVKVGSAATFNGPIGVYKARYSEQYGCGTTFSPNFTVVNANGTPKPAAPTALTASPLSRTSVRLNWTQGTGETGFEIYRAAKAGGPYTFIALAPANAVTYTNTELEAGVKYYYIIRSVNETGASAATAEAASKTLSDNVIPTTPGNLQYGGSTPTTVLLKWTPSTDDDGIKRYDIYANGAKMFSTTATSFNVFNLDSAKSYAFTVKAVDINNNESPASNQVTAITHRPGINYKYYTTPAAWSVLPDFNSLTPAKSGTTDSININNTSIKSETLRYAFLWEGSIYVPVTGAYTFETISDDGSKVYIDVPYSSSATALVSNDGVHGKISRTGTITLTQGYHSIAVAYFQGANGYGMEMYWSNNVGLTRERIPKNVFTTGQSAVSNPPSIGINYKYYMTATAWSMLPDFNSLTPVKTGVTDSININNTTIKSEITRYGFLWEGFIYAPTAATYTFETISDDGTKVYIDAPYSFSTTPLVSNDGVHGKVSKTGTITLSQGYHSIAVAYFQGTNGYAMEMYWSNDAGLARQRIAKSAFRYANVPVDSEPRQPSGLNATPLAYNKIKLGWMDNSSTEKRFEIFRATSVGGSYVAVGTAPVNATSFTDSALKATTTYHYKLRSVSDSAESVFTSVVSATTPAMPPPPVAPSKLEGENGGGNSVALSWDDNSTNETNFRVYRSVDGTTYELLATLNANTNAYTDLTSTALTSYYYYVAGSNASGVGEKSNIVRIKAGNHAPAFSGLANLYAKTGQTANEDFVVIDDAGDAVTVTIENKPAFVNVTHVSGNNFRLTANATQDNVGWYTLTLVATDNYGQSTSAIANITVADNKTKSVFIKLGTQAVVAPWNNWTGTRVAGSVITNLKDENNITTAISLTSLTSWSGMNTLGHNTGNNSGVVPDAVLDNGIADNGASKQFRFSGLNQAMRYNVSFVGSMNEGLAATAQYTSGTESAILDARYNTNKTANLNGLVPDVNGQIVVTITRTGTSAMNYLNAIILEEYTAATAMLNPTGLYAEAVDRNRIALSWVDRTNGESASGGYQIQRATDSLFTQSVAYFSLAANTTSYTNAGLVPNVKYWYRVRAKNGSTYSAFSNKFTVVTPASIVYVDFNTTLSNAAAPWNSLQSSSLAPFEIPALKNQSGANSNIGIRLDKVFNGEFTAGVKTGNNSGVVPDNVLASNYWLDNLQLGQFRLTGLNHSRRYRVGFIGSSSSVGWMKGNYTAAYSINGKTVYLNSWMNSSKVVYISDVVPNAAGEILLNFSTTAAAQWSFNSGIIIHEYSDAVGGSILYMSNSEVEEEPVSIPADKVKVIAYPNPFADNFNLQFNNSSASNKISAEVYDMYGRLIVRQDHGNLLQGRNILKIKMAAAAPTAGMYIVTLKINGRVERTIKMLRKGS